MSSLGKKGNEQSYGTDGQLHRTDGTAEQFPGKNEQSLRREYPLTAIGGGQAFLTLILTWLVPFVLYFCVAGVFSYSYGATGVYLWACGLGSMAILFTSLVWTFTKSLTYTAVLGLASSGLLVFLWGTRGINPYVILFMPCFGIWLFRIARLVRAKSAAEQSRTGFRFDFWFLIVVLSMYSLSQIGLTTEQFLNVNEIVGAVIMFYLFGRMYTLWTLERLETGTKGHFQGTWLLIFGAGLLITLAGPWILQQLFFALMAAAYSGGFLGLLLAPLLSRLIGHHARTTLHPQQQPAQKRFLLPHQHTTAVGHHFLTLLLIWIALFATVIIVFYLLKRRGDERLGTPEKGEDMEPVVSRSWLSSNRGYRFVTTTNPIRLQYQRWLKKYVDGGPEIRNGETARKLLSRVGLPDGAEPNFIEEYEKARYGEESSRES